jgi:hypothetical protein
MRLAVMRRFHDANPAKPVWAVRLGVAGVAFIAVGAVLVLCVALVPGFQRLEVLSAAVTLVISGIVLCCLVSPVERRPGDPQRP